MCGSVFLLGMLKMFSIKNTGINRSVVAEKHNARALHVQRGATCSPITFSPRTEGGPLPDRSRDHPGERAPGAGAGRSRAWLWGRSPQVSSRTSRAGISTPAAPPGLTPALRSVCPSCPAVLLSRKSQDGLLASVLLGASARLCLADSEPLLSRRGHGFPLLFSLMCFQARFYCFGFRFPGMYFFSDPFLSN